MAELLFTLAQRLFDALALSNVGDRSPVEMCILPLAPERNAKKLHNSRAATTVELNLRDRRSSVSPTLEYILQEPVLRARRHVIDKQLANQERAFHSEHLRAGQVDLLDSPLTIHGGIA